MRLKNKISLSTFMFAMAYVLFVFYLFNQDVSDIGVLYWLTKPAKYGALAVLTVGIIYSAYKKKQILWIVALLAVDVLVMIKSGVLTFILITLFTILGTKIENKTIIRIAFYTLCGYLALVIIFYGAGVYQDVITNRYVGTSDRHSLGFYHSNVLPLVYSYLIGYGLLGKLIKKNQYVLILLGAVCLFFICGSRNAFWVTVLLVLGKWFSESLFIKRRIGRIMNCILYVTAKYSVFLLSIISIGVPLLIERSKIFSTIDYIFSFRFTYILMKIKSDGLYLLPRMTNEMFFSNGIVIDNGYAFIVLRYGLLIAILLGMAVFITAKHYKDNTFVLIVITLVAIENIIDNDIVDYSCLPYLIIIEKCVIDGFKRKKMSHERFNKRNNEYIQ